MLSCMDGDGEGDGDGGKGWRMMRYDENCVEEDG